MKSLTTIILEGLNEGKSVTINLEWMTDEQPLTDKELISDLHKLGIKQGKVVKSKDRYSGADSNVEFTGSETALRKFIDKWYGGDDSDLIAALNESYNLHSINESNTSISPLENISAYIEISNTDKTDVFPKIDNHAQQLIDQIISSRKSISALPIDTKHIDQILGIFDQQSYEGLSKQISLHNSDKNVIVDTKNLLNFIARANTSSTLIEDIRAVTVSGFIDTCKIYLDQNSIKYIISIGFAGLAILIDSKGKNMSQKQFEELKNIIETKNYSFNIEDSFNKNMFKLSIAFKYR